jgi:hypothetical protein
LAEVLPSFDLQPKTVQCREVRKPISLELRENEVQNPSVSSELKLKCQGLVGAGTHKRGGAIHYISESIRVRRRIPGPKLYSIQKPNHLIRRSRGDSEKLDLVDALLEDEGCETGQVSADPTAPGVACEIEREVLIRLIKIARKRVLAKGQRGADRSRWTLWAGSAGNALGTSGSLRTSGTGWALGTGGSLRTSGSRWALGTGRADQALWSDSIPNKQNLVAVAGGIRSNNVDRAAAVVDAGKNLSRSLRFSLTTDEKRASNGERICDNASIQHKFPR